MATVKNPKWGIRGAMRALGFDQTVPIKNAGWGGRKMWMLRRGGYIRNLGVAVIEQYGNKRIVAYAHSQVSNGDAHALPGGGFFLDKEAAEQLAAMLLGAISAFDEAS